MLFRKRSKRSIPPPLRTQQTDAAAKPGGLYAIEYDMMLKGPVTRRHGVPVRQFGVYVNGSIRLVTSGDHVDRETYDALIAERAIQPPVGSLSELEDAGERGNIPFVEDQGSEMEY